MASMQLYKVEYIESACSKLKNLVKLRAEGVEWPTVVAVRPEITLDLLEEIQDLAQVLTNDLISNGHFTKNNEQRITR